MNKLVITELEFRNFLSYGDYKTELKLSKLGPVLIVGDQQNGHEAKDYRKSNGAGKSTLTMAIIWGLFGRTFSMERPGDRVVNWNIGRDCYVRIKTVDGWEITRTRKMEGHNELSLTLNGEDKTLSTAINTQKFINKQFNLDFDIFTSSTFFGQFSKSFLEMSDQRRKLALEKILNLDRINIWASVAKDKIDRTDAALVKCTTKITSYEEELARLNKQLNDAKTLEANYEKSKESKILQELANIEAKKNELNKISIPDIPKIREAWMALNVLNNDINKLKNRKSVIQSELSRIPRRIELNESTIKKHNGQIAKSTEYDITVLKLEHNDALVVEERKQALATRVHELEKALVERKTILNNKQSTVNDLKNDAGKICPRCKQLINESHVNGLCNDLKGDIATIELAISSISTTINNITNEINGMPKRKYLIPIDDANKANSAIGMMKVEVERLEHENNESHKSLNDLNSELNTISSNIDGLVAKAGNVPSMTIDEAVGVQSKIDLLNQTISSMSGRVESLKSESNPHTHTKNMVVTQISEIDDRIVGVQDARDKLDILRRHLAYIKSAYGDRNKIKSFILSGLIPMLNKRVQYYLESFECEFGIEFTPSLSILPSKWDYDFCSGGERKRIDMSIMFALYDLCIHMYGQQCNVMVLDEVDGRLDSDGIESFISVIINDFWNAPDQSQRPDTILIISHRPEMLDAFPSKIFVKKKEGLSFIDSVV